MSSATLSNPMSSEGISPLSPAANENLYAFSESVKNDLRNAAAEIAFGQAYTEFCTFGHFGKVLGESSRLLFSAVFVGAPDCLCRIY